MTFLTRDSKIVSNTVGSLYRPVLVEWWLVNSDVDGLKWAQITDWLYLPTQMNFHSKIISHFLPILCWVKERYHLLRVDLILIDWLIDWLIDCRPTGMELIRKGECRSFSFHQQGSTFWVSYLIWKMVQYLLIVGLQVENRWGRGKTERKKIWHILDFLYKLFPILSSSFKLSEWTLSFALWDDPILIDCRPTGMELIGKVKGRKKNIGYILDFPL